MTLKDLAASLARPTALPKAQMNGMLAGMVKTWAST